MTFNDFDFNTSVAEGIAAMGFEKPTPVQEMVIPKIVGGKDLIACAQTGTGKTAAYLLPVLHKLAERKTATGTIDTVVIAPTRELALQIDQQLEGFSYFVSVSSLAVYGGGDGDDFNRQKRALTKGTDIIIATPGKLISHLNLGYVNLKGMRHLILDEADRMLDMGFYDDIMKIVNKMPEKRQTLLFSATMPPKIRTLAKKILINPEEVNIAISKPAEGVTQKIYSVYERQKPELVKHLLKNEDLTSIIIFASTKSKVKELEKVLQKDGFSAEGIQSDLEQEKREEVLRGFKNKKIRILVATDIVARGIDIESIEMVLNYDVPNDAESYVHRVGRTARAERVGEAVTFISEKDQYKFVEIEKLIGKRPEQMPLPDHLGKGPEYGPENSGKKFKNNKNRRDFSKNRRNDNSPGGSNKPHKPYKKPNTK